MLVFIKFANVNTLIDRTKTITIKMLKFKYWKFCIALVLCFAIPKHAENNSVFYKENQKLHKSEKTFKVSVFKKLTARIPTGSKLTNLRKSEFLMYGYTIKPSRRELKTKIDDIKKNRDSLGDKTESIVDNIMLKHGYTKLDGKYGGNKGFDGLFIKGTVGHPTEIIIIESKQFRYNHGVADSLKEHNGMALNPPNVSTGLPAQMSDAWIIFVADKLRKTNKTEIADMVLDNRKLIIKYVSAVDKVQGEINFLKLDSY